MKKALLLLVLFTLLAIDVPVLADGYFPWPEAVPVKIPYQRAILWYDGRQETLLLQSKYDAAHAVVPDSLGWVIPVPSVPELASLDPDLAESLFSDLGQKTRTRSRVIRVSRVLLLATAFLLPVISIVTLLACLLSFYVPRMSFVRSHHRRLITGAFLLLVPAVLAWFGLYLAPATSLLNPFPATVEVIMSEQVGIYDVQVIRSNWGEDLIAWLNDNHFHFEEQDTRVFDEYVRRGWCFVVAQIDPSRGPEQEIQPQGLADPLILRFRTGAPVYPLALTALSGHETQVLIYMYSEYKWQNDGRLNLHFPRRAHLPQSSSLIASVEPQGFFSPSELALPYLCKFKDTLSPEQMQEDLVFRLAETNDPYPKATIVW
jgi:hypothetical protein